MLVYGMEVGASGNPMTGFRDWLVMRVGRRLNTGWPGLVRYSTGDLKWYELEDEDPQVEATFFRLVDEYLSEFDASGGLAGLESRFSQWEASDQSRPVRGG